MVFRLMDKNMNITRIPLSKGESSSSSGSSSAESVAGA